MFRFEHEWKAFLYKNTQKGWVNRIRRTEYGLLSSKSSKLKKKGIEPTLKAVGKR